MHNLRGQFVGFKFLIKNLNSEKEPTFHKVSGSEFHIIGPKYLIQFRPKYTLAEIVAEFAYCYFAKTGLMLLLMPDHEPLYTFPLLVAECCNHEQKTTYFSLKENKRKRTTIINHS